MAKPCMLHVVTSPDEDWQLSLDFVDCTFAFEGVKCDMGRDHTQIVVVWHSDLTPQEAVRRVEKAISRSHIDLLYAMPIEGPMYAKSEDDPVAEMVNRAWREWNEVLN